MDLGQFLNCADCPTQSNSLSHRLNAGSYITKVLQPCSPARVEPPIPT